jgi:F-type H+-transporting ATPase subunit delta
LSNWRLSKRYARALFTLGNEEDSIQEYGTELEEFTRYCRENPEFWQAVSNPIFAVEDRKKVLQFVLDRSDFSLVVKSFLKLLLDKDRMGNIEEITLYYNRLTDEVSNIAHAEIITARPFKKKTLENVLKTLEDLTSRKIIPDVKIFPELIGGIIVKIGDLVLDGSVKAQLEGLKESFKRGE